MTTTNVDDAFGLPTSTWKWRKAAIRRNYNTISLFMQMFMSNMKMTVMFPEQCAGDGERCGHMGSDCYDGLSCMPEGKHTWYCGKYLNKLMAYTGHTIQA